MDALLAEKPALSLRRVYINRLNAADADLQACDFEKCEAGELIVSAITKFGESYPAVHTLIFQEASGAESVYHAEEQIAEILGRSEDVSSEDEEIVIPDTVGVLARMMLKSHWVRLSRDDKRGRRIVERPDWEVTRRVLQDLGFLEVKNIGAGGRPDEFAHLKNAEDFLSPRTAPEDIKRIVASLS